MLCRLKEFFIEVPMLSQVENFLKRSLGHGGVILPYHTAVEEGLRNSNLKVGKNFFEAFALLMINLRSALMVR